MAPTDGPRTRALTLADAEGGVRLSEEAGWNQTVEDWRMMLAAAPAIGQLGDDGTLAATALVMPYGSRIGWIAMVLTTASHQRRGLATANLRWAIETCDQMGLMAGLDATPAGREVYRPLGFHDVWPLQRWVRVRAALAGRESLTGAVVKPANAADVDELAALDADVFGARREALLGYLLRNQSRHAWLAVENGKTVGFVLARAGRLAHHVGPLVASDHELASALLDHALTGVEGEVTIDVPDHQPAFLRRLQDVGFAPARPFTRMIRRDAPSIERPAFSFAIAGPELG